jgi:hypothetical protein
VINKHDVNVAIDLVMNVRAQLKFRNPDWSDSTVELEIPLILQALRCETADEILQCHVMGE